MLEIDSLCARACVLVAAAGCSSEESSPGRHVRTDGYDASSGPLRDASTSPPGGSGGTSAVTMPRASGGAGSPMGASGSAGALSSGGAGSSSERDGGRADAEVDGAALPHAAVIPAITETCPVIENGTVTFMGLGDIRIAAGPKPSTPTAPMLVYWHATGSTSDEYLKLAAPVADGVLQQGGVIVSFQGTTGGDLYSGTNTFGEGDLTLVDQLVACAVRDHAVDPHRVYTMGCSAGGFFATAMAALRSQYVAAAATNSGGLSQAAPFASAHAPALMTMRPPDGTGQLIDLTKTSDDAGKAFKARGAFVIDCTVARFCGESLGADVWRFFQAHPFGVTPEPWASGLPAGFSTECRMR